MAPRVQLVSTVKGREREQMITNWNSWNQFSQWPNRVITSSRDALRPKKTWPTLWKKDVSVKRWIRVSQQLKWLKLEPVGPTTFRKSRGAARSNDLIPFQVSQALNQKLAGSVSSAEYMFADDSNQSESLLHLLVCVSKVSGARLNGEAQRRSQMTNQI